MNPTANPTALHWKRAAETEAAALCEIERACFSPPWRDETVQQLIAQAQLAETASSYPIVLAAWHHAQVIGYVAAQVVGEEGEILRLAVRPAWRKHGAAKLLTRALLEQCASSGVRQLFLEVRQGNAAARGLYEQCGFQTVGLRRAYYADNENAVVMKKILN